MSPGAQPCPMIRPYTLADLGQVVDVWHEASKQAHPFLDEAFLSREQGEIAERWLPLAETLVYELNEQVVGFVALIDNEVGGLFVAPDHQSKGIGRALLNRARVTRPFLELDVFEANAVGRRFYDTYGFEVVGRSIHEATGQPQLRLRLEN